MLVNIMGCNDRQVGEGEAKKSEEWGWNLKINGPKGRQRVKDNLKQNNTAAQSLISTPTTDPPSVMDFRFWPIPSFLFNLCLHILNYQHTMRHLEAQLGTANH